MKETIFAAALTAWYKKNARDLPWRNTQNPYYIWLSEVMLQQTRVAQGLPYFLRFVEAYPTVADMAAASERDILRLWQGLGYYSRARNMHATAQYIAHELGGNFPNNYKELIDLKGVGSYTAAAIASFAFGEKVAVLDGNVYRVLARYWGIDTDIASPKAAKEFGALAAQCLPESQTDLYNQAIMEFGALQCTPASPQCIFCPLNNTCIAFATGQQNILPIKIKKTKVKNRFLHYVVLEQNGEILMHERRGKGIWQGLYEFLCVEADSILEVEDILQNPKISHLTQNASIEIQDVQDYKHILTHQVLQVRFTKIRVSGQNIIPPQGFAFYTPVQIADLPKPILVANYLER